MKGVEIRMCTIQNKRLLQGILLHDNTHPHSAAHIKGNLREPKFEDFDNSPHTLQT
jgi:hypothetical protein